MINIFSKCLCQKSPAADGVCRECRGFSLVEVTLAMMVAAIGMFSIISMFTAGLDQNIRSKNDTQAAFFAEEVFNGLLAESETHWAYIGATNGVTNLIIAAGSKKYPVWDNPETLSVIIDNNIHTNIYRLYDDNNFENHSFRYSLSVERKDRCTKSATLCVYPGEFGATNDPHLFYMSIFNYQLDNP